MATASPANAPDRTTPRRAGCAYCTAPVDPGQDFCQTCTSFDLGRELSRQFERDQYELKCQHFHDTLAQGEEAA